MSEPQTIVVKQKSGCGCSGCLVGAIVLSIFAVGIIFMLSASNKSSPASRPPSAASSAKQGKDYIKYPQDDASIIHAVLLKVCRENLHVTGKVNIDLDNVKCFEHPNGWVYMTVVGTKNGKVQVAVQPKAKKFWHDNPDGLLQTIAEADKWKAENTKKSVEVPKPGK